MIFNFRHLLLMTTAALYAGPATAQMSSHTDLRAVAPTVQTLGEPVDRALNAALEKRIVSGEIDKVVQGEFAGGVAKAVRHAYAQTNFAPMWTRNGAESFRKAARGLLSHGIVAEDVFDNGLDDLIQERFEGRSAKVKAKADLGLTMAALRAAKTLSAGLGDEGGMEDPSKTSAMQSWLTDYLQTAGKTGAAAELEALAPTHPQYTQLRTAMADYRELKRQGGWAAIPDGDLIELGDTDARVSALRVRLAKEGFGLKGYGSKGFGMGTTVEEPDLYDADMEAALKAFQRRHGLKDDGVVGGNTLEALNESVASKIGRIAETLHRWRRHGDLGERYVLANIPSYTAEGWEKGAKQISMRTVVGKPRHATPTFSDRVEYVVANPKWFVPVSIARRQKLSKLRQDPSYAPRKNYEVVEIASGQAVSAATVDWNDPDVLSTYRLVQQPGANNALGELKIIFPNQYSVYLHGTPTRHLFEEAQRAFSSGCVRLEDPEAMARWIARGDDRISPSDVSEQLDSGERERMYLGEQIPVHLTYHTVVANEAGEPVFYRDIYDRLEDVRMVKRMAELDG